MKVSLLSLCVCLSLVWVNASWAEDAGLPAARGKDYAWMKIADWNAMHAQDLARGKQGPVDLLFLGDSITQGWNENDTWKKLYAPRHAANFGIGGDTTQNVLWRITEGKALDEIEPKAIVLLIGTNNFGLENDKPEDVARGIAALLKTLREREPQAKILLLGIFPRDENPDTDFRKRIAATNAELAKLAKLADPKKVVYLEIGDKFLNEEGKLTREMMPDFLHLSPQGYEIWGAAMEPTIKQMLAE
jgi:lysophospholipase L1-like esterase